LRIRGVSGAGLAAGQPGGRCRSRRRPRISSRTSASASSGAWRSRRCCW
jgi:hypothetical protein